MTSQIIVRSRSTDEVVIMSVAEGKRVYVSKFQLPVSAIALCGYCGSGTLTAAVFYSAPAFQPESENHMLVTGGVSGLVHLHTYSWWSKHQSEIIGSGEGNLWRPFARSCGIWPMLSTGQVFCVEWCQQMFAWANDITVKAPMGQPSSAYAPLQVYDAQLRRLVGEVPRDLERTKVLADTPMPHWLDPAANRASAPMRITSACPGRAPLRW
jgi:hypothetical protein